MPPRKNKTVVVPTVLEVSETSMSEVTTDSTPVTDTPSTSVKPKREKKTTKHKVVAVVTPDGIQGSFQTETKRPLIVSLPIHTSDIQFHDQLFVYDPKPPEQYDAFNAIISDPFSAEATYSEAPDVIGNVEHDSSDGSVNTNANTNANANAKSTNTCSDNSSVEPQKVTGKDASYQNYPVQQQSQQSRREYGPTTLLVQFASSKHTKEIPSESSLACFWCCEHFSGRPCVIPMCVIEETWNVYGNFCAPQCAMAYLLSEILDTHTRWERIALLNRLYGAQNNGRVYPAPSRESLQRFGGPISSDDYRAMCDSQRVRVDIHLPPMVSILASMDTKPIDFYETPLRNTFASPNSLPAVRQSDESAGLLKLRRMKPLKDKESTLDSCLNIMVRS